MLRSLSIRDFVILDRLDLEFAGGFTALTGETGAGKSILVDALLLAAGGRAGAEVVRHGAEGAEVSATFAVEQNAAAAAWLAEQSIEHDGECILRRIVGSDGRSRAYVNGQAMPVQSLRQLGETLVDVHGQMEYQSLMKRAAQRELLDSSASYGDLLTSVSALYRTWADLREQRDHAAASGQDRAARLELLRYYLTELEALDLKPGEIEALAAERQRLSQHGRLASGAREILQLLRETEEVSAEHAISRAHTLSHSLVELDGRFAPISDAIDASLIALREGIEAIERYESDLEADPERQEWVEQRLAAIESVARKHRVEGGSLISLHADMSAEAQRLVTLEASLGDIEKRLTTAEKRFHAGCAQLSAEWQSAATRLSQRIS